MSKNTKIKSSVHSDTRTDNGQTPKAFASDQVAKNEDSKQDKADIGKGSNNLSDDSVLSSQNGRYVFGRHPLIQLEEISTSSYAKETIVSDLESKLIHFMLRQSQDLISIPSPALLGLFVSDSVTSSTGLNKLYSQSKMHALVGSALVETILLVEHTNKKNDDKKIEVPEVSDIVKRVTYEVLLDKTDISNEVKIDVFNRLFSADDQQPWDLATQDKFSDIKGGNNFIYQAFYNYIINTITGKMYVTNAPTLGIISDFLKSQVKMHLADSLDFSGITLKGILKLVNSIATGEFSTDIVGGIKAFQLITNWLKLMDAQDDSVRKLFSIGLYYIQGVEHIPLPYFIVDGTLTHSGIFAEKSEAFIDYESNIGSPIRFKPGSYIDDVSQIDIHEIMTFADAVMHQAYSSTSFWDVLNIDNWKQPNKQPAQFVDYTNFWRRQFMPDIYTPVAPLNVIKLVERMARIEMVKRILSGDLANPPFMVKQQLFYEKTSSEAADYADKILSIIYTMLESVANVTYFVTGIGLGVFKKFGADFSEVPQIGALIKEIFSYKMARSCIQLLRDDTIFINFRKAAADTMPLRIMKIKSGIALRETYSLDLISRHMISIDPHTNIHLDDSMQLSDRTYSDENVYDHIMANWAKYRNKLNRREDKASEYWSLCIIDSDDKKTEAINIARQYALAGLIPHMKTPNGLIDLDDVLLYISEDAVAKNTLILGVQSEIWGISRDVRYDLISRLILIDRQSSYMLEPTMRRIIDMFTLKYIPLLNYSYLASVIGLDITPAAFINKFPGVASVWFTKKAIRYYGENPTLTSMMDEDGQIVTEFRADTAILLSKPLDDLILYTNANKYKHVFDLIDRTSVVVSSDGKTKQSINVSFILGDVVERLPLYKVIVTRGYVENPIY